MLERTDYADVSTQWVCARKKAYSEEVARAVANRLNYENTHGTGRAGFEGVQVNPYFCSRCGRWHVGRGAPVDTLVHPTGAEGLLARRER